MPNLIANAAASMQCFRHQFEPAGKPCALCEAKRKSNGDFERARKIYLPKKKRTRKKGKIVIEIQTAKNTKSS